jgi:hypothetical protein
MNLGTSLLRPGFALALVFAAAISAAALGSAGAAGRIVSPVQTLSHRDDAASLKPDACAAAVTEPINESGGTFSFPRCGGTMARITYGANDAPPSSTFTFTSSTTNPEPSICGYVAFDTVFFPVEYVLARGNGSMNVAFQPTSRSSRIRVRHPQNTYYTLWAFVNGNEQFNEGVGTPNSQGLFTFASPLNNQTLPLGLPVCFEFGEGP